MWTRMSPSCARSTATACTRARTCSGAYPTDRRCRCGPLRVAAVPISCVRQDSAPTSSCFERRPVTTQNRLPTGKHPATGCGIVPRPCSFSPTWVRRQQLPLVSEATASARRRLLGVETTPSSGRPRSGADCIHASATLPIQRIRLKRDVTSDGTCAVRLFYRLGSSRGGRHHVLMSSAVCGGAECVSRIEVSARAHHGFEGHAKGTKFEFTSAVCVLSSTRKFAKIGGFLPPSVR